MNTTNLFLKIAKVVHSAIEKFLQYRNVKFVAVTKDATGLRQSLQGNSPSPMQYVSAKPQSVLDEDKLVETFPLDFQPENIRIMPVDQVFQR